MNNKRQQKRVWHRFVSILSCVVVFCTTYALILPAVTMERDDIVYYCGKEEHEHIDECYESQDEPQCGLEETEAVEGHTHTDDCYEVETVLTCDQDHEHTDECYEEQKKLVCQKEEKEAVEGHTHSEKCFWTTELVCGKEAHTHTRQCESNKDDKETKEEWEHSIPAKLEEKTADRVAQIAKSQKDYKEVKDNFEIDEDGAEHYYTRYGDWYGKPYEDWNVMFTSFVLKYAGIKNEQIPYGHDWNEWIKDLTEKKLFASEDYEPKNGDLIFIKDQKDENIPDKEIKNYVGIITDLEYKKVIVGDLNGQVKEITLDEKDYETNAYVEIKNEIGEQQPPVEDDETNNEEEEQKPVDEEEEQPKDDENKEEKEDKPVIDYQLPEQFDIETEDFTLVLKPRVFDDEKEEEQPKEEEKTSEPVEEDEEQGLHIKQYSLLEQENVQDKIDEENELTKEELDQIAQDNEKQQEEQREKPVPTVKLEKIEEQTTEEDQEEIEQLKEQVDEENLLDLSFYKLRFFVDDQEIDLGDQKFDAELTPTKKFVDNCDVDQEFPDAAPEAEVGYYLQVVQPGTEVPANLVEGTNTTKEETNPEEEVQQPEQATIQTMSMPMATVQTNDSLLINDAYDGESIITVLNADEPLGTIVNKTPNPEFKVQIYGRLYKNKEADETDYAQPVLDRQKNTFQVIDMSDGIPSAFSGKNIKFNDYKKGKDGEYLNKFIQYLSPEPEILYSSTEYHYHQAPSLKYFNKLDGISSYTPEKIWILKDGKNAESVDKNDWYEFTNWNDVHFTNYSNHDDLYDENSNPQGKYVLITDNTVIRLIFTEVKTDTSSPTTFWDYDFFDKDGNIKLGNKNIGINNQGNYSNTSNSTLIFGNKHISEPLGHANDLNKNGKNINQSAGDYSEKIYKTYKKTDGTEITQEIDRVVKSHPVFGIVGNKQDEIESINPETGEKTVTRKIHYNVNAPNLFFDGDAEGKTDPLKGSLKFHRTGDTYRLYGVTGPNQYTKDTLDTFNSTESWDHKVYFQYNSFWPLDKYDISKNHGGPTTKKMYTADADGKNRNNVSLYDTDDGQDHNMVFGMRYDVNFNLDENYKGPLEYFFFGDDDMWVFLDGYLLCDLGGVHQTLGAELDIRKAYSVAAGKELPTGKHTLTVYYLERGQSGSTCYIEYTLPEVSFDIPENKTGELTIEKQSNDPDPEKEYTFEVELSDKEGNGLNDDYALTVYEKDDQGQVTVDLERSNVTYHSKGEIKLKNGQYAVVKYLPLGTRFTIRELLSEADKSSTLVSSCNYTGCNFPIGDNPPNGIYTVSGEIPESGSNYAKFVYVYNNKTYQLPETGSPGIDPPLIAGGASVMTTSFYVLALQRKGRWKKRKK